MHIKKFPSHLTRFQVNWRLWFLDLHLILLGWCGNSGLERETFEVRVKSFSATINFWSFWSPIWKKFMLEFIDSTICIIEPWLPCALFKMLSFSSVFDFCPSIPKAFCEIASRIGKHRRTYRRTQRVDLDQTLADGTEEPLGGSCLLFLPKAWTIGTGTRFGEVVPKAKIHCPHHFWPYAMAVSNIGKFDTETGKIYRILFFAAKKVEWNFSQISPCSKLVGEDPSTNGLWCSPISMFASFAFWKKRKCFYLPWNIRVFRVCSPFYIVQICWWSEATK